MSDRLTWRHFARFRLCSSINKLKRILAEKLKFDRWWWRWRRCCCWRYWAAAALGYFWFIVVDEAWNEFKFNVKLSFVILIWFFKWVPCIKILIGFQCDQIGQFRKGPIFLIKIATILATFWPSLNAYSNLWLRAWNCKDSYHCGIAISNTFYYVNQFTTPTLSITIINRSLR